MNLSVVARGIKNQMKQWEQDVSAIFLPMEYEKGKPKGRVRTAVRPIQIYEIVFPEEHKDFILGAIPDNNYCRNQNKWMRPLIIMLRKILKCKKTKRVEKNGAIHAPHVMISHIGIKKDDRNKEGIELL